MPSSLEKMLGMVGFVEASFVSRCADLCRAKCHGHLRIRDVLQRRAKYSFARLLGPFAHRVIVCTLSLLICCLGDVTVWRVAG